MQDNNNTIAGWVLFAGIVALGGTLASGIVFHGERPETMGYPIEGVVEEGAGGAEAEQPIEFYLASADAAKGADVFKKCQACHTVEKGAANGLGPNLWSAYGKPHGHVPGFAYSDALKGVPGVWDWKSMNEWLTNPKKYAPGTKMTFAGLSNPEDRANVMAFLNSKSDAPLPLPAAPAASTPGAAEDKAASEADDAGAQKAENEPVLTEQEAQKGGIANIRGEGAPKVTAPGTTASPAPKQ
ncbi:cytochrome c [Sphingomonas kaistensis]|uniref:Cytochrome c n=1 Tax=Sphingomonas kaistensis TaxID=298708 RepID=A0A7X5Y5L1_9SPHN|nr:cytochrome c family protein [Sphingomonas kaistensis]NJC05235.1 cytochrome c [Sphingomonas kaistensis]